MKRKNSPVTLSKAFKGKVAITVVWFVISLLVGIVSGSDNYDEHFKYSAFLGVLIFLSLPSLLYWLGFWVWGDGYLISILKLPFNSSKFKRTKGLENEHPWRRYFARLMDYALWSFTFGLIIGLLKVAPTFSSESADNLFWTFVPTLTWIIIEPLLLSSWGSTPGKWVLGLRVESSENSQTVSFSKALQRSFGVFVGGLALGIPIVCLFTMYHGYSLLTKGQQTGWDKAASTRIRYSKIRWFSTIILVSVLFYGFYWGVKQKELNENTEIFIEKIKTFPQQRSDALKAYSDKAEAIIKESFIPLSNCGFDREKCGDNISSLERQLGYLKYTVNNSYEQTESELAYSNIQPAFRTSFTTTYYNAKERALTDFNNYFKIEEEVISTFREILGLLDNEAGRYDVQNNEIIFYYDYDVNKYNSLVSKLRSLADQETAALNSLTH